MLHGDGKYSANPCRIMRPQYRKRVLTVQSSLVGKQGLAQSEIIVGIWPPPPEGDMEVWVYRLAHERGLSGWNEMLKCCRLPETPLLAYPETFPAVTSDQAIDPLTAALILARTNNLYYQPDGPFIFSNTRLTRTLRLTQLNLRHYYAMD